MALRWAGIWGKASLQATADQALKGEEFVRLSDSV